MSSSVRILGTATTPSLAEQFVKPTAVDLENFAFAAATGNHVLSTGILRLTAIPLPAGKSIGHLVFANNVLTVAPITSWGFMLLDSSRNLLAATADQGSATWGAVIKSLAVATTAAGAATSFTTTYTGLYYLGVYHVGTGTLPTLISGTALPISMNTSPVFYGESTAGLTVQQVPGTFVAAALTAASVNTTWCGVAA